MIDIYYREQLLRLVEGWTVEQIDKYIEKLEERILYTRDELQALKELRNKKLRKQKAAKDTGTRGGI